MMDVDVKVSALGNGRFGICWNNCEHGDDRPAVPAILQFTPNGANATFAQDAFGPDNPWCEMRGTPAPTNVMGTVFMLEAGAVFQFSVDFDDFDCTSGMVTPKLHIDYQGRRK